MFSSNKFWLNTSNQRIIRTAEIPRGVRRAVLLRSKGLCENCGEKSHLELHHTTYRTYDHEGMDEPIFGKETPSDLEALCRLCHRGRHTAPDGSFWADPEEMSAEWYWHAQD